MNCRFLVLVLSLVSFGFAQDRGTIRGVVTDPTGATVPEATVTVKNINTGLTQTVKTSADGVYNVLYLPAGDYTVTTEKSGFRKAETTGVAVHVATVANVDVTLTVGAVGPVGGSHRGRAAARPAGNQSRQGHPEECHQGSAAVHQRRIASQPGVRGSDARSDRGHRATRASAAACSTARANNSTAPNRTASGATTRP